MRGTQCLSAACPPSLHQRAREAARLQARPARRRPGAGGAPSLKTGLAPSAGRAGAGLAPPHSLPPASAPRPGVRGTAEFPRYREARRLSNATWRRTTGPQYPQRLWRTAPFPPSQPQPLRCSSPAVPAFPAFIPLSYPSKQHRYFNSPTFISSLPPSSSQAQASYFPVHSSHCTPGHRATISTGHPASRHC